MVNLAKNVNLTKMVHLDLINYQGGSYIIFFKSDTSVCKTEVDLFIGPPWQALKNQLMLSSGSLAATLKQQYHKPTKPTVLVSQQ